MLVRGTALRGVLAACDEEFGRGASERVRNAMPPEILARLEPAILSSTWYEVACQAALHEAVRVTLGQGSLAANERVGHRAGLDDFRGVYRVFLPLLTWDLLWSSVARAWLRYNSSGRIDFPSRGAHHATAVVCDVVGFNEPMWYAVAGRMRAVVELAGGKGVRVLVERWSSGGATLLVRWAR